MTSFGHESEATYLYVQTGSDIFVRTVGSDNMNTFDRERHLIGSDLVYTIMSLPGSDNDAKIDHRNYKTTVKIK